eukprot:TRINITY_DN46932_c0_g1_i1.p1 TRINITY_DN46932_c0_g1~~TRINITY_DN46932_c0_g1_i1.p1  ORF type:complete len:270 (+),score=95.33 TRINITY_DN46932_c0_g1_i1:57-866(+)
MSAGEKRTFADASVEVQETAVQVMVVQPSARYADWDDLRSMLMSSVGIEQQPSSIPDLAFERNEIGYITAKVEHPQKQGVTVCLVEKRLGQGISLLPESALEATGGEGHVLVEELGNQFTGWTQMEEALGVTASDYKAVIGDEGVIIARQQHLKDEDVEVLAVLIPKQSTPEGRCIVVMKALGCTVTPTELVLIVEPGERYNRWPEMADMLGIEEPKPPPILTKGMLAIPTGSERSHFSLPRITVVALELLDDGQAVMMKKSATRRVRA